MLIVGRERGRAASIFDLGELDSSRLLLLLFLPPIHNNLETTKMSSPTSTPLPFLPTEVKKQILKFCDQPTLAKTSGLSLAFLQLSSPLLYRHIVFEGPEGLTKFLTLVVSILHPSSTC